MKIYSAVEQKIREAIERGDFDNLSTKGKPLDLRAWRNTPQHLRMSYSVLKSAGVTPPQVQAGHEIANIREKLKTVTDKDERRELSNRLNALMVTNAVRMERLHE